jgi:outer membrane protein assembly factor BamE (lipoprotein component of BamABCDE complex)
LLALVTLLFGLGVSACTPRAGTHGDPLVRDRVSSIVPGVHSRDDVAAILGSPSTNSPFDGEKWYYISSRTETFAFLPREEFDRQVVVIAFDESGRVRSVERFGQERGQDVAIVRRETPTAGNELNLVQEFLGNIGRFNKDEGEAGSR